VDPKLLFWCVALANLGVVVGFSVQGVRAIRRGDVRAHRRSMLVAGGLVAFFLLSYVLKVVLLGREDRSLWSALDHAVLYVHETCVAVMLVGGAWAALRGWRFLARLGPELELPEEPLPGRVSHRRAGWVAVVGGTLGFVTAIGVLVGMFGRS
jgi:uncharacterized membrane protein YozB (DUF420 family)